LRLSTVHSPRCASALVLSRHPAPPAIYPLSLHDALPICQGDFQLRLARLVQIQAHRNDGAAVPLDGADQLVDLLAVQQQLPVAARLMVEAVRHLVGRDVSVDQHHLAPLRRDIAFGDVRPPVAQGLDFGAQQLDSGLDVVLEEVVEACAPIFGDRLLLGRVSGHQATPASVSALSMAGFTASAVRDSGNRTPSSHSPSLARAYLAGDGELSRNSALCRPIRRSCQDRATAKSPAATASYMATMASGATFEVTEITPAPPLAA